MTIAVRSVLRLLLAGTFYAALIGLVHFVVLPSADYTAHPGLIGAALLFDLTVWPLLAIYRFVARPQQWSALRVGMVGMALLRLAILWLPASPLSMATVWPIALGTLEAAVLLITVWRIRTIARTYHDLRRTHDVEAALCAGLAAVFGQRVARIILMEGQVVYYALLAWRRLQRTPTGTTPVTTHRESGQLALLWGLLGVSLIELLAVHLLVAGWWPMVAIWVTLVSAYGCLLVLALINTIRLRPSYLTANALHLRLDLRWQAVIPLARIAAVTPITDKLAKHPDRLNAALLTAPNVLITLHEPIQIRGLYGLERTVTRLTLFVDERLLFFDRMNRI